MPPRQKLPNYTKRELRRIKQDLEDSDLAAERMGDNPEERLRWVLGFAAQDMSKLRPGEIVALGYDLRVFLHLGWSISRRYGPLPEKQVERIQKEVARGLSALLSDPRSNRNGAALYVDKNAGWTLPVARARILRVSPQYSEMEKFSDKRTKFRLLWEGENEETTILWGIADLILNAGEKLRACPECGKPFVARKRQEYCTPQCSQIVRNRRKAEQEGGKTDARVNR